MPSFIKHVEHLALYQALDVRVPASEVLMGGREGETVTPPGRGWGGHQGRAAQEPLDGRAVWCVLAREGVSPPVPGR